MKIWFFVIRNHKRLQSFCLCFCRSSPCLLMGYPRGRSHRFALHRLLCSLWAAPFPILQSACNARGGQRQKSFMSTWNILRIVVFSTSWVGYTKLMSSEAAPPTGSLVIEIEEDPIPRLFFDPLVMKLKSFIPRHNNVSERHQCNTMKENLWY